MTAGIFHDVADSGDWRETLTDRLFADVAVALGPDIADDLPAELAAWCVLTVEHERCLAVTTPSRIRTDPDPAHWLSLCPVSAVIGEGYRVDGGYIVVELPYRPDVGLDVPERYDGLDLSGGDGGYYDGFEDEGDYE